MSDKVKAIGNFYNGNWKVTNSLLDEGYCKLEIRMRMDMNETETETKLNRCADPEERTYSCDENLPCQYARLIVQVMIWDYFLNIDIRAHILERN